MEFLKNNWITIVFILMIAVFWGWITWPWGWLIAPEPEKPEVNDTSGGL